MAADLENLQAFVGAITGAQIGLPGPGGSSVVVTKDELLELMVEVEEARTAREEAELLAPESERQAQIVAELGEYLMEQQEAGTVDPRLMAIYTQHEESDEGEHEPELVQIVVGGLQLLGVPGATPEQASALLDMILAYSDSRERGERAVRPATQQLVQVGGPTETEEVDGEEGGGVPVLRIPRPANPPPFVPVTAEQLFGLTRGPGGRYDSGAVDG